MVLSGADLKGLTPQQLTVRTATVDHLESVDSVTVHLPPHLAKELTSGVATGVVGKTTVVTGGDGKVGIHVATNTLGFLLGFRLICCCYYFAGLCQLQLYLVLGLC
jgi:hypothetical protein